MPSPWPSTLIEWKSPGSWVPAMTKWLKPELIEGALAHLRANRRTDLYDDDSEWLDVAEQVLCGDLEYEVLPALAEALTEASVRCYHGCRCEDAGAYHRLGIRLNDPEDLAAQLRDLVDRLPGLDFLRSSIDERIRTFDATQRDTGKLYVVLDDRRMVTGGSGHYLLYGSEWMQCILGFEAHLALLEWGSPTMIEVDLPLRLVSEHQRFELARALLQEWTRQKTTRPKQVWHIDFSFMLRSAIPSEMVVGHYHPEKVVDPFHGFVSRLSGGTTCPSCSVQDRLRLGQHG